MILPFDDSAWSMVICLKPRRTSDEMRYDPQVGGVVLLPFGDSIVGYDSAHKITRGPATSVQIAVMFGEYFPAPGFADSGIGVTMGTAVLAEALGTFLLVLLILVLTDGCNVGRPADGLAPVFVGAAVTAIISVIGPLTQAGINPARDFGPRLVSFVAGWGGVAIPGPGGGFFVVYIAAPRLGGAAAALGFRFVISKLMTSREQEASCSSPTNGEH